MNWLFHKENEKPPKSSLIAINYFAIFGTSSLLKYSMSSWGLILFLCVFFLLFKIRVFTVASNLSIEEIASGSKTLRDFKKQALMAFKWQMRKLTVVKKLTGEL